SGLVQLPVESKLPGNAGVQPELGLTCVAPPPVRSLSVAVPAVTLSSSVAFPWRSHTLASNVSTHVGPTFTESRGQVVNGPTPGGPCGPVSPCGPAAPAAPCEPVGPAGPCGPAGPAGPARP